MEDGVWDGETVLDEGEEPNQKEGTTVQAGEEGW